jgi:hypothetical protein
MEKERSNVWSILISFAVGAAAGAATAYLMVPENRAKLRQISHDTSQKAGRVPKALKEASSAARRAFTATYQAEAPGDNII